MDLYDEEAYIVSTLSVTSNMNHLLLLEHAYFFKVWVVLALIDLSACPVSQEEKEATAL